MSDVRRPNVCRSRSRRVLIMTLPDLNIDCRDCGPDWCEKHVPVTVTKVPCESNDGSGYLSESYFWCHHLKWWIHDLKENSMPGSDQGFNSYQDLNDWFIANVIQEVTT